MDSINITSAQYIQNEMGVNNTIKATINGREFFVPLCVGNTDYDEIMRQVEAGTLVIAEAE